MDEYETMNELHNVDLIDAATEIVSAYVSNNQINKNELSALIQEIFGTLKSLDSSSGYMSTAQREPAVPVAESVTADYIICLEDGKRLKMLRRHLRSAYNMSPEQYRERWGLSADYPMVAPNYAERRSKLAKDIGLGKSRSKKRDLSVAA